MQLWKVETSPCDLVASYPWGRGVVKKVIAQKKKKKKRVIAHYCRGEKLMAGWERRHIFYFFKLLFIR